MKLWHWILYLQNLQKYLPQSLYTIYTHGRLISYSSPLNGMLKKKCHFILSFDNSVYFGTKTEYFGVLTHNFQSNYGLAAVFSIYILLTRILGVGFGIEIYKYFINGLCLAHFKNPFQCQLKSNILLVQDV